jgi:hypothetical protein
MKDGLRFRQIHLDFHTSPFIDGIGEKFDRKQWQDTLKKGHVDSITTFAVCHHGWSYYDTKVGEMHPQLKFDLLREQYEASKEIGVNVPIYITAGVNDWLLAKHPEWREIGPDGRYLGWSPSVLKPGFRTVCFNSPGLDFLCQQIIEVALLFPECDGIFLDIISQGPCCCPYCLKSMRENGYDPELEEDRKRHAQEVVLMKYYRKTTDALRSVSGTMPIFHNSGHITRGKRDILPYFSHLELESLPTGGWGYDHFPISAKYVKQLGMDFLGMTGKFHNTWGEFGGFKHPNALRYECAAMLAYGARCSVGDQLHPCGELDDSTYEIIGQAYAEVEAKEPWVKNAANVADIALLSVESTKSGFSHREADESADTGAARVLLEEHFLFDIIDTEMDFDQYKMLILPDCIAIDGKLKNKLDAYLASGGRIVLSGDSGLNQEKNGFVFDTGAEFCGAGESEPDYILPAKEYQAEFVHSPLVMYKKSNRIKVRKGESLGQTFDSYFNRTWEHYCSHQHTPNKPEPSGYDCGVINGNILYFAHPVFSIYYQQGAVAYRQYIAKALRRFLAKDQSLLVNMPSTGRVSMSEQKSESRYVLHLLYANTIKRGGNIPLAGEMPKSIEVIEELMPLNNIKAAVKVDKSIKKVTLEPQGQEVPFFVVDGVCEFEVDSFTCHQMAALHY